MPAGTDRARPDAAGVLNLVDQRLRMLHPHPDGQGFQLDVHLLSMQLLEDIPRRMSGRQNHLIAPVDAAILHAHALSSRSPPPETPSLSC